MREFQIYTFLEGQCLGHKVRGLQRTHEQLHVPFSHHYFCPACGEVWAKVVVMDEKTKHCFLPKPCPQHGLGSLLCSWDDYLNLSLATKAILREIDLCLSNPEAYKGYLY